MTARRLLIPLAAALLALTTTVSPGQAHRGHHGCGDATSEFCSARTVLHRSSPGRAGLDASAIREAQQQVRAHEVAPDGGLPLFPGAVATMGHRGKVVTTDASGWALRYADASTELPRKKWIPMRDDTIFDVASVSKLFTSIAVVQLVEEGKVRLDAPVATYLPEFAAGGKQDVTVQQLLSHTSGFQAGLPLWSKYPDQASRIKAVMDEPLTNPAGSTYLYSDLNMISLGVLVEKLRGKPLDQVVAQRITRPLHLRDTGYNPRDRKRVAATEYQATPARGLVWGQVHDENSWSLGGVAGHAGVFSTARDLSVLSQTLLNGGTYAGHRILSQDSVRKLVTDVNGAFPGDAHGLGFELDQDWYMGALAGPRTAGHTGYTGTSIVIDFERKSFAILLTNRVHPTRTAGSVNPARVEWADGLARAMGVPVPEPATAARMSGTR